MAPFNYIQGYGSSSYNTSVQQGHVFSQHPNLSIIHQTKLRPGQPLKPHLDRLNQLRNEMAGKSYTDDPTTFIDIILNSLPLEYSPVRAFVDERLGRTKTDAFVPLTASNSNLLISPMLGSSRHLSVEALEETLLAFEDNILRSKNESTPIPGYSRSSEKTYAFQNYNWGPNSPLNTATPSFTQPTSSSLPCTSPSPYLSTSLLDSTAPHERNVFPPPPALYPHSFTSPAYPFPSESQSNRAVSHRQNHWSSPSSLASSSESSLGTFSNEDFMPPSYFDPIYRR